MSIEPGQRHRGCLLGLAVGDALGARLEFARPGTFEPIADMLGGGPHGLEPGQWTDDTAMSLCLGESLLATGFDVEDQMRRYLSWYDNGEMSSTGECFDIGNATRLSLERFREDGNPFAGSLDPGDAGNGSIMRLAPVALYWSPDDEAAVRWAAASSRTTHATVECVEACRLLAEMLSRALRGLDKISILAPPYASAFTSPKIRAIAEGSYLEKDPPEIRGTGYVVRSLEAALWAFSRSEDYHDAILAAANLGEDADTTAAVTGQLAGAHWGEGSIPLSWLEKLTWRERIGDLAAALGAAEPKA